METKVDAARDLMTIMGANDAVDSTLRTICGRFKDAIKRANPSVEDDKLDVYDSEFLAEIPALHAELMTTFERSLGEVLTDAEVGLMTRIAATADVDAISRVMKKYNSARDDVDASMRPALIAAHARTSQRVFNAF
jgi:hypothetical protein